MKDAQTLPTAASQVKRRDWPVSHRFPAHPA